ncbi:MAG: hypothetical protein CVV61_04805 [Tenericutes bacterium HGW-Tenericutes-6]|nr:MAG: hypothetical protein CVV61_04805 [Tenericutes bacterium HGW-Tenericutes-6]
MKILVIGGAVIDLFLYPHQTLKLYDSNPGYMKKSVGGVGRNIAENLSRLGFDTTLMTAIAHDEIGDMILHEAEKAHLKIVSYEVASTPTYVQIIDHHGDDYVGIAAMDELTKVPVSFFKEHIKKMNEFDLIVMDTNLSEEVTTYLLETLKKPMYVDVISTKKALKVKHLLDHIHTIKLNLIEAETLTGINYKGIESLNQMGDFLISQGVKEVLITLGKDGAYYADQNKAYMRKSVPTKEHYQVGAGDAFFAGAIYGKINHLDPLTTGIANALINLHSEKAVYETLTKDLLEHMIKEYLT